MTTHIYEQMAAVLAQRFPALKNSSLHHHHTCVYDYSRDGYFIMDNAPGLANTTILCGSSGHGFKMGPAVGEMVTDLLIKNKSLPSSLALNRLKGLKEVKSQFELN